jgi:hypothetical protein
MCPFPEEAKTANAAIHTSLRACAICATTPTAALDLWRRNTTHIASSHRHVCVVAIRLCPFPVGEGWEGEPGALHPCTRGYFPCRPEILVARMVLMMGGLTPERDGAKGGEESTRGNIAVFMGEWGCARLAEYARS